jgi:hypothetical protein
MNEMRKGEGIIVAGIIDEWSSGEIAEEVSDSFVCREMRGRDNWFFFSFFQRVFIFILDAWYIRDKNG